MQPFYPLILAAALWAQGSESAAQPSAFDLLEEVRESYSLLASYSDAGRIELSDGAGDERRFEFETHFGRERGLSLQSGYSVEIGPLKATNHSISTSTLLVFSTTRPWLSRVP